MGLEILSFTIKDVSDKVQYLDSLGIAKTEDVKREAAIGKAEAMRDSDIKVPF
jgi:flotillin